MSDYIPADKRPPIGECVPVNDLDWDKVILQLQKDHAPHCEAYQDEDNPVIIWVDETKQPYSDGRSIYVFAECQRCMKGGRTSLKENPDLHISQSVRRARHAQR